MAIQRRTPRKESIVIDLGSGVYLASVVSVMDSTFNGRLRVTLLKDQGNDVGADNQTYVVNYASPFFGYTPFEAMGKNNTDFNDTQKSYGMWFVPPDVGVTVMCVFVDGDPGEGYWFACLPPSFSNQMVPGIAGTTQVDLTDEDKKKFNTKSPLPTGEINKRRNSDDSEKDAEKIKKPVHPIADKFLEQGTLEDDVRGVITSTSRRQTPNSVFGISTPGPLDWRDGSKRMTLGPTQNQSETAVPVSRLGGTQFVIDDGDDRYVRDTSASTGPVKYIDVIEGRDAATGEQTNSKGQPDVPYNEHTRIRTRTGHQILMHNSEDLIYIGNAKGTTWIEMTSNGKIDIYAKDSVSIHTESDLNITADRDIIMSAGRNICLKAGNDGRITAAEGVHINAKTHTETAPDGINMNGPTATPAYTPMRTPQHEPWLGHENLAPTEHSAEKTDADPEAGNTADETGNSFVATEYPTVPDTFRKSG